MKLNVVLSAIAAASLTLSVAGCSSEVELTEAQVAMSEAGPYVAEASDSALRACSGVSALVDAIESDLATFATGATLLQLEATFLDNMALAFNAAEITPRYIALYEKFQTVDNALLDDNLDAFYVLLDDVMIACSDMTVVDNEELSNRGIDIEPGNIPRVSQ